MVELISSSLHYMGNILASILPATAFAAVILFVIREILEFAKRRASDRRKIKALKALIARELEQNMFALRGLNYILNSMADAKKCDPKHELQIVVDAIGGRRFRRLDPQFGLLESDPLPVIRNEYMGKYLLDVAVLSDELFTKLEAAYDSTSELKHVLDSAILHISDDDGAYEAHFEGFVEYGRQELTGAHANLERLYQACTGESLKRFRIR